MGRMAPILSHPFRLAVNGNVATVDQQSAQANAEQIAVLVGTIQGERPLAPGFGIPDPAFAGVSPGVVTAQVARWGPQVTVRTVAAQAVSDTLTDLRIGFD